MRKRLQGVKGRPGDPRITADPAEYPALIAFFADYLHSDYAGSHGGWRGAVDAFCEEATPEEISEVLTDWRALLKRVEPASFPFICRLLGAIGCHWIPDSEARLGAFTRALEAGLSLRSSE
jgi:hypothetical protein